MTEKFTSEQVRLVRDKLSVGEMLGFVDSDAVPMLDYLATILSERTAAAGEPVAYITIGKTPIKDMCPAFHGMSINYLNAAHDLPTGQYDLYVQAAQPVSNEPMTTAAKIPVRFMQPLQAAQPAASVVDGDALREAIRRDARYIMTYASGVMPSRQRRDLADRLLALAAAPTTSTEGGA